MNEDKRILILKRLQQDNAYQKEALNFSSSFELLIAILLSARTTDIRVKKVTEKLYLVANTPRTMLKLGAEGIKFYIKTLGLSNNKSKNVIEICRILIENYGGKVPENRSVLESLPGVGRKTANVVLNMVFGWPAIAVDTHVFRVCNRTNFAPGKNVRQVEEKLLNVVPTEQKVNCHRWLFFHGHRVCTARRPHCGSCVIEDLCEFKEKIYFLS